jgi:SAM-dependent methyltransferase
LTCSICGGQLSKAFDSAEAGFAILRCGSCGYGRNEPVTPEAEIGKWYPPAYYGRENVRFNPLFERLVRWFRLRRARVIASREKAGRVLDVGCGRGVTLAYLRELGFTPHGVELSDAAAWHAREKLGIPVYVGPLAQAPYPDGHFRAIVFWHSLEHMLDPKAALEKARAMLEPGGLLVVAVPNSDSLQARWFGKSWFHLDVPRHYVHFGARSLKLLLGQLGFRVVQEDHFSFEQNPYGWLQSLFNALGFRFNLLYSMFKHETAQTHELRKHPIQVVLTVLLFLPFLALSGVMTLIEAALRRGGTVEIYAVK